MPKTYNQREKIGALQDHLKFDVVRLGDNRYGVRVRYYEWGIKLFTEYGKLYKGNSDLDVNDKIRKAYQEMPWTKKLPSKNDEQSKKTDFENNYSGTIKQCTKLYGELIDINYEYCIYERIFSKFNDWDVVGGHFKLGSFCLLTLLYIILLFIVHPKN